MQQHKTAVALVCQSDHRAVHHPLLVRDDVDRHFERLRDLRLGVLAVGAASAESCSRRPMRLARADGARLCIASPGGGRSPCLSGPCQCPFLDGGPAHSGHSQDIGVDFALRFGFAQNNQKNIAGCDTRASHSAIAGHRKVRHDNIAPCDSLTSHPATSRYRTLPLPPVAPCDSKSQLSTPKITPLDFVRASFQA